MWRRYIDRYQIAVILIMAIAYIFMSRFSLLVNSSIRFPIILTLPIVATIPVSFGFVIGAPAVAGSLFGYLIVNITGFGVETVFMTISHVFLALTAVSLRNDAHSVLDPFGATSSDTIKAFANVCVLGSAGAAAIVAWGHEVATISPFFYTVVGQFLSILLVNMIFSPILLLVITLAVDRLGWWRAVTSSSRIEFASVRSLRYTGAIVLAWMAFGFGISIFYTTIEKVSRRAIPEMVEPLLMLDQPELFGPGGAFVQVIFGAVMFSVLLHSYAGKDISLSNHSKE